VAVTARSLSKRAVLAVCHERISRLFEDTIMSDAEIMTLTGHTNIRTLEGYMKLRPSHLAKKMEAITR
jgi:hypothetical protein